MACETYDIRAARAADIPAIRAMQGRSMRALGAGFYPEEVIAAFLERIGTMDDAVVHEGHFLVADAGGAIVGSGGWSRLTPGYARTAGAAAPVHDATIRSVFVDPAAARRGIASAIMARAEADAGAAGVRTIGLAATLSGLPLYLRLGYRAEAEIGIHLDQGRFGGVIMEKALGPRTLAA
jgi:GNAT superfamily N-acetyltransferase